MPGQSQALLLMNLGSPDSPSVPDLRRYLREFLMDKRVIDAPYPIRFGVVHFSILPKRPHQSAEAYQSIWLPEGPPLVVTSRSLQARIQKELPFPVELAMRYQNPSVETAIQALIAKGISEIILLPLFPHYAMSSYETAVEKVRSVVARIPGAKPRVTIVPPFYDHPAYISALSETAAPFLAQEFDHLLFSFHGLPERDLHKADPTGSHCLKTPNCCETPSPAHATCYRAQCFKTVRAFAERTALPRDRYSVAFQSRLGRDPWMQPYTDKELERLAQSGIEKLLVMCPAFTADCLETIEEIGMRGREIFEHAGGTEFRLIPCLNDSPGWVAAIKKMISPCIAAKPEQARAAAA